MEILPLIGLKGILAALGGLAVAAFGLYIKWLRHKAKQADAWKARAASAERENESRIALETGKLRIDSETGAGLAELAREAEAKKKRISNAKSVDEVADETRRMFGGGAPS